MTEQEAIKYGKDYFHDLCCAACKVADKHKDFVRMSIKALEEIQQYRAIGTPEECRAAVEKQKELKSTNTCGFITIGKTVEQFEQEIRYKAIDDFAETCKQNILCQTFGLHPINIDKIAELLKVGDGE